MVVILLVEKEFCFSVSREIEFKLKGVIGTKMLKPEKIEKLIADYYVALRGMEGTKWAAKFDEEATIEDPVGTKPITGGREVFEQFYRNAINANFQKIDIQEESDESDLGWESELPWDRQLTCECARQLSRFLVLNH